MTMKNNFNSNSQIKLGAIISYTAILFNIIAGFIYTPWLVKQIGQSDYGLYTLAMSVIAFFLMDFGISGTISRFISLYRAKGEEKKVGNLLGITYKLYLIIDIFIFIALLIIFIFIQNIFVQLTIEEINKFRIIFLIVGGYSLISFPFMPLNGILMSYEKFINLKLFELIQKILSILLVIIVLTLGKGLYALVIVNAAVNISILLFKLMYINNNIDIKVNLRYKDKKLLKEIFNFSIWMTVISIAQRLIINISPTILGMFSGSMQISVFAIGVSLEGYTWTFANALNGLFLPKVTRMAINEQDNSSIVDLMIKVGRVQLAVVGIIMVGLFSMGKEFITIWMGNSFQSSYYVAIFLIGPGLITLTQEIAYNYLVAINEVKYRAYDFIGSAVISIVLSVVLTPKYGAIGAALSAGIGIFIGHVIIMNIIYYKVFKLDILRFFKECHLKMAFPLIISLIVGILLQKYIPVNNLVLFSIKAMSLSIIYAILMWKVGLNHYEKGLFKYTINSVKRKLMR